MKLEKEADKFRNDFNPFKMLAELRALNINSEFAYKICKEYEEQIYKKVIHSVRRYI